MKRKRPTKIKIKIKMSLEIQQPEKFSRKRQKLEQELEEISQEKSRMKLGNWLEEKSKEIIEELGGICTITRAHSYRPKKGKNTIDIDRDFKVIGDYGMDGIGEITLNEKKYKFILQCKNWSKEISSSQVSELEGVLNRFPGYIGLFITRSGANNRARITAKESSHNIILLNVEELYDLKQVLKETKIKTFIGLKEEIDEEYQGLKINLEKNIIKVNKFSTGIKRTYMHYSQED